jgi:hypothetical protein
VAQRRLEEAIINVVITIIIVNLIYVDSMFIVSIIIIMYIINIGITTINNVNGINNGIIISFIIIITRRCARWSSPAAATRGSTASAF